jgi:hypothetical protein
MPLDRRRSLPLPIEEHATEVHFMLLEFSELRKEALIGVDIFSSTFYKFEGILK